MPRALDALADRDTGRVKNAAANENLEDLERLAELICGISRQELLELRARFEDPAEFATYLTGALQRGLHRNPVLERQLGEALRPVISVGVHEAVEADPSAFGQAIAPVIGPAIRSSVRNVLREFTQGLENTVKGALSLRGLRWRFEALSTGQPFAEVALKHSLLYRVEDVFLFHGESGLLLQSVSSDDETLREAELISAMLSAIESFVKDAFETQDDESLGSFQVGDLNVFVERSGQVVLAVVVRGEAPALLLEEVRSLVESIAIRYRRDIEAFDGDTAPFVSTEPLLASLLRQEIAQRSGGRVAYWVLLILLTALLGYLAYWMFDRASTDRVAQSYAAAVAAEPGMVVTDLRREDGGHVLELLRDPLARPLTAVIPEAARSAVEVRSTEFFSADTALVVKRANRALGLLPGETVTVESGSWEREEMVLQIEGVTSPERALELRSRQVALPGVDRVVVLGASLDAEAGEPPQVELENVRWSVVRFPLSSSMVTARVASDLERLVNEALKEASSRGSDNRRLVLRVGAYNGNVPSEGDQRLADDRYRALSDRLAERGVESEFGGLIDASVPCEGCTQTAGLAVLEARFEPEEAP